MLAMSATAKAMRVQVGRVIRAQADRRTTVLADLLTMDLVGRAIPVREAQDTTALADGLIRAQADRHTTVLAVLLTMDLVGLPIAVQEGLAMLDLVVLATQDLAAMGIHAQGSVNSFGLTAT